MDVEGVEAEGVEAAEAVGEAVGVGMVFPCHLAYFTSEDKYMSSLTNKHIVLEELQRAFDKKMQASDTLDGKLQNILNYSSVIVGVVATIMVTIITSTLNEKVGILFWFLLGVVLILYLLTFLQIKKGLNPAEYHNPISNDIDELNKKLFKVEEEESVDLIIKAYVYCMNEATSINLQKENILISSSNLMLGIVVGLLLTPILGVLIPSPTISEFTKQLTAILSR